MKNNNKLQGLIEFIGLIILGVIYSVISWGLVLYKFWYWFIQPVFTTLPTINFMEAVGLMMFINLFRNQNQQVVHKVFRDDYSQFKLTIISPWLMLFVGWFVKVFIVH
jgi:hypothetical protein